MSLMHTMDDVSFDFQPSICGSLLDLRGFRVSDWEALLDVASDPLIWEQHPIHRDWRESRFSKSVHDALAGGEGLVAIDRANGELAGYSRFTTKFVEKGEIEIGWTFLARKYWGGQYNRELKLMMLRHALATWPVVIFRIGESNFRSQRAMEKLGGKRIERVSVVHFDGQDFPHICYSFDRLALANLERTSDA